MAKDVKDSALAEHSGDNRKGMLGDALKETLKLDREIKALLETHIKPLREEKADIKAKLREDLNITPKVFNARYASFKLESEAHINKDDVTLDALRELYEVAPIGQQMDWLEAA